MLRVLRIRFPDLAASREVKEGVHACYHFWTVQVPTRSKVQVLKLGITRLEVSGEQWLWAQGWAPVVLYYTILFVPVLVQLSIGIFILILVTRWVEASLFIFIGLSVPSVFGCVVLPLVLGPLWIVDWV